MRKDMLLILTAIFMGGMMAVVWGAKAPGKKAATEEGHRHEHGERGHRHDEKAHAHEKEAPGRAEDGHEHGDHDAHGPGDDHHGEEPLIRLSDTQLRQLGVELAVARAGTLETHLTLPGSIGLNTERVVRVVPRMPGVVREVRKRLGDTVRAGEVLAVIDSRELADAKAGYLAASERFALAESTFAREKGLWEKKISPEQDYLEAR